jgi:YD repeat-containing protein
LAADGGTLSLAAAWSNAGKIVVNNSTLNLGGSFTTDGIGNIDRTGGTINLVGLLDNTDRRLSLDAVLGSWNLGAGGTLRKGKLVTSDGEALRVTGGTLEGLTLGETVGELTASATVQGNSGAFFVTGNLTFTNGSLLDLGNPMILDGDQTLGGDGEIRFRGSGGITNHHQTTFGPGLTIHRGDANSSDINMVGGSITNRGTIRSEVVGGRIRVTGNPGASFTNAIGGMVAAEGGTLTLLSAWSNAGQIAVNHGTLNLGGSFTTEGLGAYSRTAGTINLVGLLDNTGSTFALDATTGSWNLDVANSFDSPELRGGNLVTSGGAALVSKHNSGTLNGVTLGGAIGGVPASATVQSGSNLGLTVTGGLTFTNGSLVDLANNGGMTLVGDQTLGGDGEIRLRGAFGAISNNHQTTFGPGLTIRSDANTAAINMVSGSITNQGTIRAEAGQLLVAGNAGTSFTNAAGGVVAAAGGTLVFNDIFHQATTNYAAGTLTGGTWQAIGNSTLRITGADITTNAATIVLDGAGARLTRDAISTSALTNLATNAAAGNLTLRNGANRATAGSFTNNGSLTVGPASTFTTNGAFTQDNAASLAVEIGGAPASGQLGRLVTTGTAALDGALDVRRVSGYGPEPGLTFPILSFANRTGDFDVKTGLTVDGIQFFEAVYDATSLTLNSLAVPADLAFVSVSPPATIIPGQQVSVPYTVQNRTGTPVVGDWIDSLYLSADGLLDPSDVLLGRVEHQGGLAGNTSYMETLTAIVPALAEGDYRVIVLADSRRLVPQGNHANDAGGSAGTTALSVPLLSLGEAFSGTIAHGQDLYFRFDLAAGRDVRIAADYAAAPAAEFVQRYASLPDRATYDQAAPNLFDLHPRMLLVTPLAGRHYVLLHGREGSGAGQPFTIRADFAPLIVSTIAPNHGSNAGQATVKVTGSGFTPSTAVNLVSGATTRVATAVQFVDGSTLFATFDLKNLAPGAFDVQVLEAAQTAAAAGAFTVSSRAPGRVRTYVSSPGFVRPGTTAIVRIGYFNDGDTDLPAPLLTLRADNATLRFPGDGEFRGSELQVLGVNREGPAGILPPGFHGSTTLEFRALELRTETRGNPYRLNLFVVDSPNDLMDWDAQKEGSRPNHIPADAWDALWDNFITAAGPTVGDYQALMGGSATALSRLGIYTADPGRLFAFELLKADAAAPMPTLGAALDVSFPAPGLPLTLGRAFLQSISGRYGLGALGRGWMHDWETGLADDGQGNVTILSEGYPRLFVRQPNGTYAGALGDFGSLTLAAGVYRLRESDGSVTAFSLSGRLEYVEDRNGNRIAAGYTGSQLTSLTHANGTGLTLAYNTQGRLSQVADPAGRVVAYRYDAAGEHLLEVTDPAGTTQFSYLTGLGAAREHALASITFPDGANVFYDYDSRGRLVGQRRDGGADSFTLAYDAAGGMTLTDALGNATQFLLDEEAQVNQIRNPLGQLDQFRYDAAGQLVRAAAPGSAAASYRYDARGNLAGLVNPMGHRTEMGYDPTFNQLSRLQDARDNITTYSYDVRGNHKVTTYPDGTTEQSTYDSRGNLIRSVNRRGQAIDYTFDPRGLLTRKTFSDGSQVDYTYDAHGNLLTATDARGSTAFEYDAADRPTKVTYPGGRFLQYSYDAGGRRTRTVDQGGFAVNYAYDAAGRLAGLRDEGGAVIAAYAYNLAGRLTREDQGNGAFTTYEYDTAGQLLHLVHHAPGGSVSARFDYAYDVLGRVTSTTTLEGTTTYAYDAINSSLRSICLAAGALATSTMRSATGLR